MRRLFLAVSALTLLALAGCGRKEASTEGSETGAAPSRQPAEATAPPARQVTQASAVSDGGAYGMPRAPIPYNALGAYEQRLDQAGGAQDPSLQPGQPQPQPPAPPSAPPRTRTTKPRSADTVFY